MKMMKKTQKSKIPDMSQYVSVHVHNDVKMVDSKIAAKRNAIVRSKLQNRDDGVKVRQRIAECA